MRTPIFIWFLCLPIIGISQSLDTDYISRWKNFYPSKAYRQGIHSSIYGLENFTQGSINEWINYNASMLKMLNQKDHPFSKNRPINARLLQRQIATELNFWQTSQPQETSLALYVDPISNAIAPILKAPFLVGVEKVELICQRLGAIASLCQAAKANLKVVDRSEIKRGEARINAMMEMLEMDLVKQLQEWEVSQLCPDFVQRLAFTMEQLMSLEEFIEQQLKPKSTEVSKVLGEATYAKQLALYTDSDLQPGELAEMARTEIDEVKHLMTKVATTYLKEKYPDQALPDEDLAILNRALQDMEKDAPKNGAEYLEFWLELEEAAYQFIEEKEIATLPAFPTLQIKPAPESAGPAARIGWVDAAPPFDPNPVTTLYLPSIPDTLPVQEQIDFWSSFNKPFNRMIVIHELLPGHYMQIKISRETPHPIRLLFPYGPYFEGWATFAERVCLDAGWEEDDLLTLLAHLRKRLENANRAYTSVMVHCDGWDEAQVWKFSRETALLAPQFAKSLWGRLLRSPMQMTSYFWGKQQFTALLAVEQKRLGDRFVLKTFMDTIMQAGPIPMDEFAGLFKASIPD